MSADTCTRCGHSWDSHGPGKDCIRCDCMWFTPNADTTSTYCTCGEDPHAPACPMHERESLELEEAMPKPCRPCRVYARGEAWVQCDCGEAVTCGEGAEFVGGSAQHRHTDECLPLMCPGVAFPAGEGGSS